MTYLGTKEFLLEVAKGNVAGHSLVHKFGRAPDIQTADNLIAIWAGTKGPYLGFNAVAGETIEVFSSSAADAGTVLSSGTATGGSATTLIDSGATFSTDTVAVGDLVLNDTLVEEGVVTGVTETTLTVRRMGKGGTSVSGNAYRIVTPASTGTSAVRLEFLLDGDFAEAPDVFVVLNGVTGVLTPNTYIRNSRMVGLGDGSGVGNVGNITARQSSTTANIFAVMPIGYSMTMIAQYTVPAGKTGYLLDWYATIANKQSAACDVRLRFRPVGGSFQVKEEIAIDSNGSSYVLRDYKAPKNSIESMSDIGILADTDTNSVAVAAGIDVLLIDNSLVNQ